MNKETNNHQQESDPKKENKPNWINDFVDVFNLNVKETKFLIVGILSILHHEKEDKEKK